MALSHWTFREVARKKRPWLATCGPESYRSPTVRYSSNEAVFRKLAVLQKNAGSEPQDAPQSKDEMPPGSATKSQLSRRLSFWTNDMLTRKSQRQSRREMANSKAQPEHTRHVAEQLRRCPENASKILIDCFASGNDIPQQTIALCLDHAFRRRYFKKKTDEGAIARPILKYVLDDSNRWLPLLLDATDYSRGHLCYFAILEGLERVVQDLCMVEVKETEIDRKLTPQRRNVWRGTLFADLVRAHSVLTPGNIDSAMRTFLKVVDRRNQQMRESGLKGVRFADDDDKPGVVSLSIWPAILFIFKELFNGTLVSTDGDLYERFEALCRSYKSKSTREQHAWHCASLALFRPESPQQQPMAALLRKIIEDHRIEQGDEGDPIPGVLHQAWAIRAIKRTHKIALHSGNAQDAEWLAHTFGEALH